MICLILCILMLGAVMIYPVSAGADSSSAWTLFENLTINVTKGTAFARSQTFRVQLPEGYEKGDFQLHILATVNAEAAAMLNGESVVELCNHNTCDTSEITWNLAGEWVEGKNDLVVSFNSGHDGAGSTWTGPAFTVESPIVYFRLYSNTKSTGSSTIKLEKVYIEMAEGGIEIGGDNSDTYLALSKPLTKTPQTVEINLRAHPVEDGYPIWTKGTIQNVYANGTTYDCTPVYRVWNEESGPGYGAPYLEIRVGAGTKLGFEDKTIRVNAGSSRYEDLALDFWIYMTEGSEEFTFGQLELTSGNTCDVNEIYFTQDTWVLSAGWNHLTLPFTSATLNKAAEPLDISNINFIRWHTTTLRSGKEAVVGLSRIRIIDTSESGDGEAKHYSILSSRDDGPAFALSLTKDGYPSVRFGTDVLTIESSVMHDELVSLAFVRDTGKKEIRGYLDGELKATVPVRDTFEVSAQNPLYVTIGADPDGSSRFSGVLSNLRLWDTQRPADKLLEDAERFGVSGSESGLIGAWTLDGSITNILKQLKDATGSGQYGQNPVVYRGTRFNEWIDYQVPEEIGSDYYTLAFIPDPQNITVKANQAKWEAITDWIRDNLETENIFHVISAGDDTWSNTPNIWEVFSDGMAKFWNDVSWSSLIGNHDYVWSSDFRDSRVYNQYLGLDRIEATAASDSFAGWYEDDGTAPGTDYVKYPSGVENSYYLFDIHGTKWMILQLEYSVRPSVIRWANNIVRKYEDYNVIVATHGYLMESDARYMTWIQQYMTDEKKAGDQAACMDVLYNSLIKPNSNIKMVLSGHSDNPDHHAITSRNEKRKDGTVVYQYMINAQYLDTDDHLNYTYYDNQAVGMLGLFRFSKDGSKVAFNWYCPPDDKTYEPIPEGNDPGSFIGPSVHNKSNFVITLREASTPGTGDETETTLTPKTETEPQAAPNLPETEAPAPKKGCGSICTPGLAIGILGAGGAAVGLRRKRSKVNRRFQQM